VKIEEELPRPEFPPEFPGGVGAGGLSAPACRVRDADRCGHAQAGTAPSRMRKGAMMGAAHGLVFLILNDVIDGGIQGH